jgi:hypothetical protein
LAVHIGAAFEHQRRGGVAQQAVRARLADAGGVAT